MTVRSMILFTLVLATFQWSLPANAQTGRSMKRSVATVLFSTLGGAILGLSTLPFYGDPEEHTSNITTGALLGALAGGSYLIYSSTRPTPSVDYSQVQDWGYGNKKAFAIQAKAPVYLSYQFEF